MRYGYKPPEGTEPSLLGRVVGVAAGAVLLIAALMFSVVIFAFALAAGLLVWGWVWWKTREVRRQMREQMEAQRMEQPYGGEAQPNDAAPGGRIIEGEVIRDEGNDDGRP
jgi:membrane protein implicated in regulation of membrane protease activity